MGSASRAPSWCAVSAGSRRRLRWQSPWRGEPPQPFEPPTPAEAQPDERVDELRRKLEEARTVVDERDEFESGETTVDEAEAPPTESPDDRRKHVHERAKASVERMQRLDPGRLAAKMPGTTPAASSDAAGEG